MIPALTVWESDRSPLSTPTIMFDRGKRGEKGVVHVEAAAIDDDAVLKDLGYVVRAVLDH